MGFRHVQGPDDLSYAYSLKVSSLKRLLVRKGGVKGCGKEPPTSLSGLRVILQTGPLDGLLQSCSAFWCS